MGFPPPPTTLKVLLSHLKVIWKHWNVHSLVLASFSVQIFLIFFAPLWKKSSNRILMASLWLAYLLADWIAIIAIGVISDPCGSLTEAEGGPTIELYAFWAQFLLLHLGGADSITALAVEDNELWLRTGLHLAVQVYGGLGILVKSVPHSQTSLWLPTLLMFVAGVIKYAERLSSLFHGSLLQLCYEDPGKFLVTETRGLDESSENRSDKELVRHASFFFEQMNMLYVGITTTEAESIRDYMIDISPEDALKMLEIEFNLAYEALYTKTALICRKLQWKILRLAVILLEVGCLVIWLFFTDKHGFKDYNILITYTLLISSVALDVFAFVMIHMLSEWIICLIAKHFYYDESFLRDMVFLCRKRTWGEYTKREDAPFWASFRRALFKQWSESIPQLSFLSLCMGEKSNKVLKFMGLEGGIYQFKYVGRKWFSNDLRDYLYEDIKTKRKSRGALENIGKVKGGWACHGLISNKDIGAINIPSICQLVEINEDYITVVLRWHIITEVCYQGDHMNLDNDVLDDNFVEILSTGNESKNINATNTDGSDNKINYREICKTLSDYLMYLVVHRRDMLSLPQTVIPILESSYDNLKKTIMKSVLAKRNSATPYLAYEAILDKFKSIKSGDFDKYSCTHFPGMDILRELEELEKMQIDKWRIMTEVWGELLYYAAIKCDPKVHLANVKQGGELLSFVWLWLAHLGFGLPESGSKRRKGALLHMSAIEDCELPED